MFAGIIGGIKQNSGASGNAICRRQASWAHP
jgi:hypothetical protein